MSGTNKHLYLVDGHAIAYRAYFAMLRTPLTNAKGQATGAVMMFALTLLRLIQTYKCPYLAVVFDSPVPTFRHHIYEQYKANREAMPDDLKTQIPLIFKLVEAFNVVSIRQDGLEADDILAHLTRDAVKQGFDVSLVTKDKDLMQLIGPGVRMLAPETGGGLEVYGPEQVKTKMGVAPEKIRDLLALMGDSSDNVPGVAGVGEKTAIKILEKVGDIATLMVNPAAVDNPKLQAKIEAGMESLKLSLELVTLKPDVKIDVEVEDLKARPVHREACIEMFKELEFRSLLSNPVFAVTETLTHASNTAASLNDVSAMVARITAAGMVSIDTETTSTQPREAKLVGISLAVDEKDALYIPVGHVLPTDVSRNLPVDEVLALLRPVVESADIAKIGQNLKYDYQVLKNCGVIMRGIVFDTMVAAYLVDPGKRAYGLDALAADMLGLKTIPIESLIGKGAAQKSFAEVSIDDATRYSTEDVVLPIKLRALLQPMLDERNVAALFRDVEIPLVTVLADMEWQGIMLDSSLLGGLSVEARSKLETIRADIYQLAGEELNLNSPKQISEVLFDKMGLPKSKKTKTGLSTDVDALEKLAPDFPIARRILDYREVQKLLSTYIDALPGQVCAASGRLHSSFNQTIAATGRLSSTNPNLQNIPVRTDEGRRIREAFVAPMGHEIVSADYSQIELRILAHVAQDPILIQAFHEDRDIHAQTASAIYGVFPEMVTPEMRRAAKTINFGLMYGMGPLNLARQLGISFKEAQTFIDTYFMQFPSIHGYMDATIARVREVGYAETLLGRRRYLPDISAENRQVREGAERTAINTPIQGTAADIIKIAMINIHHSMPVEFPDARLLLQVHDELVFEAPDAQVSSFRTWVSQAMSSAFTLDVPLKVDAGAGANWSAAH
jgi:DNA polymerase-1